MKMGINDLVMDMDAKNFADTIWNIRISQKEVSYL